MVDSNGAHPPVKGPGEVTSAMFESVNIPTDPSKPARAILAVLFFLLTLLVVYQTGMCTRLVGSIFIKRADLEWQIQESNRLRHEATTNSRDPNFLASKPTVAPHHVLFSERDHSRERNLIIAAVNSLLIDRNVCNSFPKSDGLPLEQTEAVIVPLWRLSVLGDRNQMGITEAGFVCSEDDHTLNPGALTIREKPLDQECIKRLKAASVAYEVTANGTPRMTKDGIPRIALSANVLDENDPDELKLTLLHEFVHVHAIPGYRPFLNYVHDDLTYLSEYDALLSKTDLNSKKQRLEIIIWLLTGVGTLLTIVNTYPVVR